MILKDIFFCIALSSLVRTLRCLRQTSSCSCETDLNGSIFSLQYLDAGGNANYAFQVTDSSSTLEHPATFQYNPCKAFICSQDNSAAVCKEIWEYPDQNIGLQSTAEFQDTNDTFEYSDNYNYDLEETDNSSTSDNETHSIPVYIRHSIILRYTDKSDSITSEVFIVCQENERGKFSIIDVSNNSFYQFKLETKFACREQMPDRIYFANQVNEAGGGNSQGGIAPLIILGIVLILGFIVLVLAIFFILKKFKIKSNRISPFR